jgi:hypothetical protein
MFGFETDIVSFLNRLKTYSVKEGQDVATLTLKLTAIVLAGTEKLLTGEC